MKTIHYRASTFIMFILILFSAFLFIYAIKLKNSNNELQVQIHNLSVVKGKNMARAGEDNELKKIKEYANDIPVNVGLIWAIRQHENGIKGLEYGVERPYYKFKEDKQLKSCVRIVQQVIVAYFEEKKIRREILVKKIGERYNFYKMDTWGKDVGLLWEKYLEEEVKP